MCYAGGCSQGFELIFYRKETVKSMRTRYAGGMCFSFLAVLFSVSTMLVSHGALYASADKQDTAVLNNAVDPKSESMDETMKVKAQEEYGKLPLYFIQNNGQVDGRIRFYEKGSGHATFFTKRGIYLSFVSSGETEDRSQQTRCNESCETSQASARSSKRQPRLAADTSILTSDS